MSNLIKSTAYVPLDEIKKIEIKSMRKPASEAANAAAMDGHESAAQLHEAEEAAALIREQLIAEAKAEAEQIVRTAQAEAERMLSDAKQNAEAWWQEQRQQDDQLREKARQAGFDAGFAAGQQEAELQVKQQYEAFIQEGRTVLEQAYEASRQTIADSEPFLIELSTAIAAKIISKQLELEPVWIVDMIQKALKRSIDKEKVTLCVAPSQYGFVQSVRDELANVIDAQAELHILPDASVRDQGCVIKTSFGTIDARIETQLTEIKQALLEVCKQEESRDEE